MGSNPNYFCYFLPFFSVCCAGVSFSPQLQLEHQSPYEDAAQSIGYEVCLNRKRVFVLLNGRIPFLNPHHTDMNVTAVVA